MNKKRQISIIGGAGHVGFPLGLVLSSKGYDVKLIDKHLGNIKKINSGKIPFLEKGAGGMLKKMLKKRKIFATTDFKHIKFRF